MPPTLPELFRAANDYSDRAGFAGAFPNMHTAYFRDGRGQVYGTHLLPDSSVDWRNVRASALGNPESIGQRLRSAYDYAVRAGYGHGFPNFHQGIDGSGLLVYGTMLVPRNVVTWRDVPVHELGTPTVDPNNLPELFRRVASYASRVGFRAGMPNGHTVVRNGVRVFGTLLFTSGVEWRDVRARDLGLPTGSDRPGRLRVMTYNVGRGIFPGQANLAREIEDCDVALLQELPRTLFNRLRGETAFPYSYYDWTRRLTLTGEETEGQAILSRWPLARDETVTIPTSYWWRPTVEGRRIVQIARVAIDGAAVILLNTRWHHEYPAQRLEGARVVATALARRAGPAAFGGDLNAGMDWEEVQIASVGMVHASTAPNAGALAPIDHLFCRGFRPLIYATAPCLAAGEPCTSSDHPWVIAELERLP